MRKLNLDDNTKKVIFHIANNHNSVVILDASYHMHRFAYVHRLLSINNEGVNIPTGHIYGFLKMICYLRRKFENPAIIIAVDGYDKERKLENSGYKANRPAREFSVHAYIDDIVKMCAMMPGVYVSYNEDYEADDTIYNVSRTIDLLFKKNNIDRNVYIYATDKDLFQCISGGVYVVKKWGEGKNWLTGAEIVDESGAREAFNGVRPDRIAMFRSIAGGDTSDNIKGYFRFPKKQAAIIAEECVIVENSIVPPDEGFYNKYPKIEDYLSIINNDFDKFRSNYKILKLKEFDFTLRVPETGNAVELIKFYQMNSYRKELEILVGIFMGD